jgi:LytS/YehU family sensor histidine kinase
VFSLGHAWLYWLVCYADSALSATLFQRFHSNLITYWAIVAVTAAFDYFAKYRERERELREAQLTLLKSQLHPHFLFNTLHTISAMMHEDLAGADRMVSRLSDLLRLTLEHIGRHEVTLREELEVLKSYFEIERVRFHESLRLAVEVDPEVLDALVPSMILQPLVENSIRHGFGARKYAGSVTVRASRRDDTLVVRVLDDGVGLSVQRASSVQEGLGLANTRRRLENLYPAPGCGESPRRWRGRHRGDPGPPGSSPGSGVRGGRACSRSAF